MATGASEFIGRAKPPTHGSAEARTPGRNHPNLLLGGPRRRGRISLPAVVLWPYFAVADVAVPSYLTTWSMVVLTSVPAPWVLSTKTTLNVRLAGIPV